MLLAFYLVPRATYLVLYYIGFYATWVMYNILRLNSPPNWRLLLFSKECLSILVSIEDQYYSIAFSQKAMRAQLDMCTGLVIMERDS